MDNIPLTDSCFEHNVQQSSGFLSCDLCALQAKADKLEKQANDLEKMHDNLSAKTKALSKREADLEEKESQCKVSG